MKDDMYLIGWRVLIFVLTYKTLKETVNSYVPKVAAH